MADPLQYRELSNPRLEELWKREGDERARDILLTRRWRRGNLAAARELLRHYEPLFEAECDRVGLHEEAERHSFHEELQLNLLMALRRGDLPNWFASHFRSLLFRLLSERGASAPAGTRLPFEDALATLAPEEREILRERVLGGRTARELARNRHVTVEAVADALERATTQLLTRGDSDEC